jgi:hypothetical protein
LSYFANALSLNRHRRPARGEARIGDLRADGAAARLALDVAHAVDLAAHAGAVPVDHEAEVVAAEGVEAEGADEDSVEEDLRAARDRPQLVAQPDQLLDPRGVLEHDRLARHVRREEPQLQPFAVQALGAGSGVDADHDPVARLVGVQGDDPRQGEEGAQLQTPIQQALELEVPPVDQDVGAQALHGYRTGAGRVEEVDVRAPLLVIVEAAEAEDLTPHEDELVVGRADRGFVRERRGGRAPYERQTGDQSHHQWREPGHGAPPRGRTADDSAMLVG